MSKELVFSVTKDDCEWSYFSVSGAGGQGRDRSNSGARCFHRPSGAVGRATESRSQLDNRRTAMRRLAEHPRFKIWVEQQLSRTKTQNQIEAEVEALMSRVADIKTEIREGKKWKEVDASELS